MKTVFNNSYLWALLWVTLALVAGCKKDEDPKVDNNVPNADYVLVIENGAFGLGFDETISLTAYLLGVEGIVIPESLTWSSSASSVISVNAAGLVSVSGAGISYIKATATYKGKTYEASVPVAVNQTTIFTVLPQAIIWSTNSGTLQLEPIYFGQASASFAYASSNTSIASVSASGEVSFNSLGECTITVTGTIDGTAYEFYIPVLVVGEPGVPLPVSRVSVSPASAEMFRGETQQFTAKAFNSSGEVSGIDFTWTVSDAGVASIDNNGLLTARNIGEVTVYATAEGIRGQAEVFVNPDTFVVVNPYNVSKPKGGTQQFTAKTYRINRSTGVPAEIPNLPSLAWEIPTVGFAFFDIATITNTGLATVKQTATEGLSTVVLAGYPSEPTILPGTALLQVAIGEPGGCQCGTDNPDVVDISVSSTSLNLSVISNPQADLNGEAVDAFGDPVSGASITYCSDNMQVASVDFSGSVFAVGEGTATITACVGNVQKTITVNVTF